MTTWHIDRWKNNKFITLEKVKKAPDFIKGDEDYRRQCYKCHTTGYDEKTGTYVEEGVTCEACHGPGQFYVYFMSTGKVAEAQRLSKLAFSYDVCGRCHMARNHEARSPYLAQLESAPEGQTSAKAPGIVNSPLSPPSEQKEEPPAELPPDIQEIEDVEDTLTIAKKHE